MTRPGSPGSVLARVAPIFMRAAPILIRAAPILALCIAWEVFARSGAVTPFQLPRLSAVFLRILDDAQTGEFAINTGLTLYRALVGFAISVVGGVLLGAGMARSVSVRWFFDPIISVGFPMPKIAFLPIMVLWLGFFDVSKIAMIVLDAIFPVVTATVAGLNSVERELIWSARNMGASERELLRQAIRHPRVVDVDPVAVHEHDRRGGGGVVARGRPDVHGAARGVEVPGPSGLHALVEDRVRRARRCVGRTADFDGFRHLHFGGSV